MNVTALSVVRAATHRRWAGLRSIELAGRIFANAAEVQAAWFDAVLLVDTSHFFFIDDTDELPGGYLDVLGVAVDADRDIAYTDEVVRGPGGSHRMQRGASYTQSEHLQNPLLLHHLVLCSTAAARQAIGRLPRGKFWPEMLLYWEMAKAGAAHIPAVGYIWNKGITGLHAEPFTTLGMVRSQLWCREHP